MLRWAFRVIVILVLTAAIGGVTALFTSPDWLTAAGLAMLLYAGAGVFLKAGFRRLVSIPFIAKGKVLRGATVEVHSVEAIPEPDGPEDESYDEEEEDEGLQEEEGEEDDWEDDDDWNDDDWDDEPIGPVAFYQIDLTITPKPQKGSFSLWDPSELLLVPPGTPSGMKGLEEAEEHAGHVWDYDLWDDEEGGFVSGEDFDKHGGPLRMRVIFEVPADIRQGKFQYYFENFGEVDLPESPFVDDVPESTSAEPKKEDPRVVECRRILAAEEKKHGEDGPGILPALRRAARTFCELEMYFEVMLLHERELAVLQAHAPGDARSRGAALNNLAGACWYQGLHQEAAAACRQALEIKRAQLGEQSPEVEITLRNMELLRG